MIVRILGEGQYNIDDEHLERIEELDSQLDAAIKADDEETFAAVLAEVIEAVRSSGKPVDPETIAPSSLTVPHEGATIAEVKALLAEESAAADEGEAGGAGIVAGEAGEG